MLSGGLGGVQAAFAAYTELLVHLGHETHVCMCPDAAIAVRIPASVRVHNLANQFEHDPVAIYRAVRLLRETKPDVVLTHGKRALVIFTAARRFVGGRVPIVNVLHRHRFKRVDAADMSICVSRRLCDEAAAAGIDQRKLVYVPNFLPTLLPANAARAWSDPPVLGFLGRMVPEKGGDLFIAALALLKAQGVRFRARIGGDGPLKPDLMRQAETSGLADEIEWLGWVHDVPAFYEGIDLFCVPSRWESFGIVVLNAMNAGRPLVATRTAGPMEIIQDGANGLLCDTDAGAIAAALRRLIDDRSLAARLARQGHIDSHLYAMPNIAPKVDAVLRSVVTDALGAVPAAVANDVVNL